MSYLISYCFFFSVKKKKINKKAAVMENIEDMNKDQEDTGNIIILQDLNGTLKKRDLDGNGEVQQKRDRSRSPIRGTGTSSALVIYNKIVF